MRQSQLFTKTRREAPTDESSKNAELLIRAGYINKEMAGVYSLLPLSLMVVNKIKKIVSDEINSLGSEEITMSTIQNKEVWQKTDRWSDERIDIWFKSKLKNGSEVGFGWSHEEPIVEMMKFHIASYNDLPRCVHQFQNKLRNETRTKSGILRCREFIMKDMYYFAATEEENKDFYNKAIKTYKNIYNHVGLGDMTFVTSASGGVFTDEFSHEFQTICEAGEDLIYVNKTQKFALNEEIFNQKTLEDMKLKEKDFEKAKSTEVGNIFNFATKKCEKMGFYFSDKNGKKKPVYLSSYGIGITRLMGTIVEALSDEKGIIWPESVAPFKFHIIEIPSPKSQVMEAAEELYKKFGEEKTLYDDRNIRAGEKFVDADLLGMPYQIVVSEKNIAERKFELKNRSTGEIKKVSNAQIDNLIGL